MIFRIVAESSTIISDFAMGLSPFTDQRYQLSKK
jgi:hypothetical protein